MSWGKKGDKGGGGGISIRKAIYQKLFLLFGHILANFEYI